MWEQHVCGRIVELVVDAMGAGSRMCLWLGDTWDTRVPIERLSAGQLAEPSDIFTPTPYLRRRFDHAERLPGGVIALGGSLCSLGSSCGQSLNLALYHTDTLQRVLREGAPNRSCYPPHLLPRRYFEAVMRIPCC